MRTALPLITAIAILGASGNISCQEAGPASLRIISPKDNSVFRPGETVHVEVEAHGNVPSFMLIGQNPLGMYPARQSSNPYHFSVKIPAAISPRKYQLTAFAPPTKIGADPVTSYPLTIDIERVDQLLSVSISPDALELEVGHEASLTVEGVYADGSQVFLNDSTQTSFVSESPSIAKVTRDGFVTAIAAGSTRIRVNRKFVVPVTVKPRRTR